MSIDPALLWNAPRPPPRQPQPGELLFAFVRASDGAPMTCDLRFHGETYGWETQFLERGELVYSRGGFVLRELATRWAEQERDAMARHEP
jgi:hypothetical protein